MPPRKNSGRSATLASLMAAGVSAPTLGLADDGLGLTSEAARWAPSPLVLVSTGSGEALSPLAGPPPELRLLPDLDDR